MEVVGPFGGGGDIVCANEVGDLEGGVGLEVGRLGDPSLDGFGGVAGVGIGGAQEVFEELAVAIVIVVGEGGAGEVWLGVGGVGVSVGEAAAPPV